MSDQKIETKIDDQIKVIATLKNTIKGLDDSTLNIYIEGTDYVFILDFEQIVSSKSEESFGHRVISPIPQLLKQHITFNVNESLLQKLKKVESIKYHVENQGSLEEIIKDIEDTTSSKKRKVDSI